MATYDNLPIYKKTYDLLVSLFRICQNMERDYKFTIGENLKKEVIELIMNVYRANCCVEKVELLEKARENIEVVRLLLRLLNDLKQVSIKEFASLIEIVEGISKQLSYWLKSQNKIMDKNTELMDNAGSLNIQQADLFSGESC